jgi:hypothetical protein
MNSKYKIITGLYCLLIMAACRNKPVSPEPLPAFPNYFWANYMGTYDVYDTVNHTQWVMKISHIYHSEYNQGNEDSVLIENFANRFNMRYKWRASMNYNKPILNIGVFHPIIDRYNLSWHISTLSHPTLHVNLLQNDSMLLYFKQSNIAFYQADAVPYYACDCKHIAVKRH